MIDPADAVAGFVVFGDFGSEGDDGAGEIAAYCYAGSGEDGCVDVFPEITFSSSLRGDVQYKARTSLSD